MAPRPLPDLQKMGVADAFLEPRRISKRHLTADNFRFAAQADRFSSLVFGLADVTGIARGEVLGNGGWFHICACTTAAGAADTGNCATGPRPSPAQPRSPWSGAPLRPSAHGENSKGTCGARGPTIANAKYRHINSTLARAIARGDMVLRNQARSGRRSLLTTVEIAADPPENLPCQERPENGVPR